MTEATVHIVDDDDAVRQSLGLLVHSAGLRAVEYANGREFLDRYRPQKPECLLLDLYMPDLDGLAVQREIARRGIDIAMIFLSGHGDIPIAVQALREGAVDFVEKPFDNDYLLERLVSCIQADADRERARVDCVDAENRLSSLTRRERQIVDMLVAGKINKIISAELNISIRTVESHRARIMKKLNAGSLSEVFKIVLAARDPGEATGER